MFNRIAFILSIIAASLLASCVSKPVLPPIVEPTMVYKPIDLGQTRIQLTESYLCQHYQVCNGSVQIEPQMIVLHWTGTQTWQQMYQQFQPAQNAAGALNSSMQFIVTRYGTVYQLMPSAWMARAVTGLDYLAINIANVGDGNVTHTSLTQAQVDADVYLIRMLKQQYPGIHYVIGHYEYTCFENTPLFKGFAPSEALPTVDPGPFFMHAVRARIQDLNLKTVICKL